MPHPGTTEKWWGDTSKDTFSQVAHNVSEQLIGALTEDLSAHSVTSCLNWQGSTQPEAGHICHSFIGSLGFEHFETISAWRHCPSCTVSFTQWLSFFPTCLALTLVVDCIRGKLEGNWWRSELSCSLWWDGGDWVYQPGKYSRSRVFKWLRLGSFRNTCLFKTA